MNIRIPQYTEPSWIGTPANNEQNYMGWITSKNSKVVASAVESYQRCVSPFIPPDAPKDPDTLRKNPRVSRWIFSTDGVGYPIKESELPFSIENKNWIKNGDYVHPPMFGIGAGYEHHCHKLGEYLHKDHIWCPIAVLARFPSIFAKQ